MSNGRYTSTSWGFKNTQKPPVDGSTSPRWRGPAERSNATNLGLGNAAAVEDGGDPLVMTNRLLLKMAMDR